MSFFNSILKVMGFANDDNDNFENEAAVAIAGTGEMPQRQNEVAPAHMDADNFSEPEDTAATPSPANDSLKETDPSVILTGVVDLLNRELPPYLRQCLDEEKQRRHLYALLDESIKDYIARAADDERARASKNAGEEKKKIKSKIADLEAKLKASEEKLSRETEKALSAERQKRGMIARVRDVENQVAALQAEKEQYDLENKSLLNKLRVMSVTSGATDETIATQNIELKEKLAEAEKIAHTAETKISDFEKEFKQVDKTRKKLEEENKKLKAEIKELTEKNNSLIAKLEDAEKGKVEAVIEQSEPDGGYIAFEEDIEMIIPEAKVETDVPEKNQADFSPEILIPTDISTSEPIHPAEEKNDTAGQTENLSGKKHRNRKKKKGAQISAIDENLADTDWLVAEPPPATANDLQAEQADFGYKEPQRKPVADNPAQMSLW